MRSNRFSTVHAPEARNARCIVYLKLGSTRVVPSVMNFAGPIVFQVMICSVPFADTSQRLTQLCQPRRFVTRIPFKCPVCLKIPS